MSHANARSAAHSPPGEYRTRQPPGRRRGIRQRDVAIEHSSRTMIMPSAMRRGKLKSGKQCSTWDIAIGNKKLKSLPTKYAKYTKGCLKQTEIAPTRLRRASPYQRNLATTHW